jgi:hypothetical protein
MQDTPYYDYPRTAFPTGQRVELHPATDEWMRGARYGVVVSAGYLRVAVRLDVTGRTVNLRRAYVRPVDTTS